MQAEDGGEGYAGVSVHIRGCCGGLQGTQRHPAGFWSAAEEQPPSSGQAPGLCPPSAGPTQSLHLTPGTFYQQSYLKHRHPSQNCTGNFVKGAVLLERRFLICFKALWTWKVLLHLNMQNQRVLNLISSEPVVFQNDVLFSLLSQLI